MTWKRKLAISAGQVGCAILLFLAVRPVARRFAERFEGPPRPTVRLRFLAADTRVPVQPLEVGMRWVNPAAASAGAERWERCRLGSDGALQLREPPIGARSLCISAMVPREFLEVGDFSADLGADLEIPLRRGGSIQGHVVGGEDRELPSQATVLAVWDATSKWDHGLETTKVDSARAFRFERVPPDTDTRLFLEGLGRRDLRASPVVTRVGRAPVILQMSAEPRISGRVEGESCCSGWTVEACREDAAADMFARWGTAEVGNDGAFAIDNLPMGQYRLVVLDEEGGLQAISEPVTSGTERSVIRVPRRALLKGYVEGIPPRLEAEVRVRAGPFWNKLHYTEGGYFDIRVPVGIKYDLRASCEGGARVFRDVVPPENVGPVILTPEVRLVGRVTGIDASTYVIVSQGGFEQGTWTCGGACFVFGSLLPEDCRIIVLSKPAFYAHALAASGTATPSDGGVKVEVSAKAGGEEVQIRYP